MTGCTKLSAGCDHCYAEGFAERFRDVAGHPDEPGFDLTRGGRCITVLRPVLLPR